MDTEIVESDPPLRRRIGPPERGVAVAWLVLLLSPLAWAQPEPEPREWKRRFENTFAFVLNPVGVQDAFEVSWTQRLNDRTDPLFKDAHAAAGLSSKLTPAFERIGVWFEYSPLSVIDLRVGVEPAFYFGTYKALLPFESADLRFDDEVIEARQGEAASGLAGRLYISPTLKARAGPVVARIRTEISFWKAQDKGAPFFYEPAWDTLIKASGSRVLTLEAVALRELRPSDDQTLLIGPAYDLTTVKEARANRKQDVGLVMVWSRSRPFHALKDPTIAAKVIYFIEDPWRRHQAAAQIAFVFGL